MQKTHDLGRFFTQFLTLKWTAPLIHRTQTQEVTEPYRSARPLVISPVPAFSLQLKWVGIHIHERNKGSRPLFYVPVPVLTGWLGIVLGYWRDTGLEEHEALAKALNTNEDHASAQATDFDAAIEGVNTDSSRLGRASFRFIDRGMAFPTDAGDS
jgi:hypothetical protein